MTVFDEITVRPDAKGRITLGKLAKGVSSFRVIPGKHGRFILEPYAEIPAREKWLFENKPALAKIKRGLQQSAKGKVRKIGSFAKHVDDNIG